MFKPAPYVHKLGPEVQRTVDEIARIDAEKEVVRRREYVKEFSQETSAALERLTASGWPDVELGRVRNPDFRWYNLQPRYMLMHYWHIGFHGYLGADSNLWLHVNNMVPHDKLMRTDVADTDALGTHMLRTLIDGVKRLPTST